MQKVPAGLLALLILASPVGARQDAMRADADSMRKKMQAILDRSVAPPGQAKPLTTNITDSELNAYLRLDATADLPVGLKQPTVVFLDGGKVDTRALVDLDMIRVAQKRGWLDPLSYVTGTLEVRTVGTFHGANGKGVFAVESATVGGMPVPKTVLQELVAFYTRSPEAPQGIPLDAPFELPHRIRNVELRRGMATVIQ